MMHKGVMSPAFILREALKEVPQHVRDSREPKEVDLFETLPYMARVPRSSGPMKKFIS